MAEELSIRSETLTLRRHELEAVRELTDANLLSVARGLLEWYFGGEPASDGVSGAVLSMLVKRQEDHLRICAMRAEIGRRGGKAGSGGSKARFGNKNASKTQAKTDEEERKQNASKTEDGENAESTNKDTHDADVCGEENASKSASKTQAKRKQTAPLTPPSSPLHPSTTPYNPPNFGGSSCVWPPTAARGRTPAHTHEETPDEVVEDSAGKVRTAEDGVPVSIPDKQLRELYANQLGIPLEYLASFMAEMRDNGWGYVNRGGQFVTLNRRNFKYVLRAFHATHNGKRGKQRPAGVKLDDPSCDLKDFERRMKVL